MCDKTAGRPWHFSVDDMIACAEKVLASTSGLDRDGLVATPLVYDATVRNLELIGEAATHARPRSNVPSRSAGRLLVATRNRLIHGDLGIDNDILWSIVESDVPGLLPVLRSLRSVAG